MVLAARAGRLRPRDEADLATDYAGHNVHVVGFVSAADVAATIPGALLPQAKAISLSRIAGDSATETGVSYYMSTGVCESPGAVDLHVSPLE